MPSAVDVAVRESGGGWVAEVTVRAAATTNHEVGIPREQYERYGGGDVADLVRRSFAFLLEREPNTSILARFDLATIERYFPEYPREIRERA